MVWRVVPVTFSAHTRIDLDPRSFTIPAGGSETFDLLVSDRDFNSIGGGSQIDITVDGSVRLTGTSGSFSVPDAHTFGALAPGVNWWRFTVSDDGAGGRTADEAVTVHVVVSSDSLPAGGNGSSQLTANCT